MLDINLFRADRGGDPDAVRTSQTRRFADPGLVDQVIALDLEWKRALHEQEQASKEFNRINKEIGALRKAGQDTAGLQLQSKALKARLQEAAAREAGALASRDATLSRIGNVVHSSVPVSKDEADNEVFYESEGPRQGLEVATGDGEALLSHPELVRRLHLADTAAGAAAAGARAYYLLGDGVMLNQARPEALISYGLHFLRSRGWDPVQTPYWLTAPAMARCAQLAQYDEELYRLSTDEPDGTPSAAGPPGGGAGPRAGLPPQGSPATKYLIATSEQALCAMHQDSWLPADQLPIRYAGFSTCFRREVGSHGKDTLGIFRVHQFEKVEQFAITSPLGGASDAMLHDMVANAQDFYSSLGIPYRLVRVVSGALNAAASAKVDLEGWFPASACYRELVSASNCTSYQARRLGVRVRLDQPKLQQAQRSQHDSSSINSAHAHMLNATLVATQRTLCCLLENHQTKEGVKVPPALQPYMHGQDFIRFMVPGAQRALSYVTRLVR